MDTQLKALLLAGGRSKHALRKVTGQQFKALMTIESVDTRPIIYPIMDALQKTKYISQVYLALPEELQRKITFAKKMFIPSGPTLTDTLNKSIPRFNEETHILISTCDLPLLSSQHINHFIENCLDNPEFDIYYPIIEKKIYTQSFPGPDLRRVYANLIDGSFTGGNLFLVNPRVITDCIKIIEQFILFRKHPLKMASILGKRIVIKYLKKYLSIRDLEKMVPTYLKGYTGKAILSDPEIALDIDKPIQLEALKSLLKQ